MIVRLKTYVKNLSLLKLKQNPNYTIINRQRTTCNLHAANCIAAYLKQRHIHLLRSRGLRCSCRKHSVTLLNSTDVPSTLPCHSELAWALSTGPERSRTSSVFGHFRLSGPLWNHSVWLGVLKRISCYWITYGELIIKAHVVKWRHFNSLFILLAPVAS